MNIDALVENFYNKIDVNEDLINEVMKFLLVEADIGTPPKATFDWSMIPDIPISEIGWSDVTTIKKDGKTQTILGPQRALLEQYLSNIGAGGGDLQQQIESLEEFYTNGPSKIVADAGEDRVEVIKKLVSYLVFYKTLTKVVTNFNAASAGFTFESFLATLMKGTQIPTNSNTIADFTTGENLPISLKLYAETGLNVEGSFTDLVNDLVEPKYDHPLAAGHAMRYILCTKRITGKDLQQTGTIGFYQFDFTLDNVFAIMAVSKDRSQRCIHLPMGFIESVRDGSPKDYGAGLPARENLPSPEKLESDWRAYALETFLTLAPDNPLRPTTEEFERMLDTIDYAKSDRYFKPIERGDVELVVRGISTMPAAPLRQVVRDVYLEDHPKMGLSHFNAIAQVFAAANNQIIVDFGASELKKLRTAALEATEWMTNMEELVEFYKGLKTPDLKALALKNTRGYLDTFQFALNRKQSTTEAPPINTQKLGVLSIGGENVEKMLKQVSGILNDEIFTVFTSLKTLSDSLNGFFAGGLSDKDSHLAVQAISSANEIQSKTAEHSGQDPRQLGFGFEEE